MSHPKSVTYVGVNGIRQVTREEWEQAGVLNQDTVQWNDRNRWKLKGELFTEEAIEILEAEGQFVFEREEDKKESEPDAKKK